MASAAILDRQLDRFEAVGSTVIAAADWTTDPVARVLIASCVKRPPARTTHFATYIQTRDEWSSYTGDRVKALEVVRDGYGAKLLTACDAEFLKTRDRFVYAPYDRHRINSVEAVLTAAIQADIDAEDARQMGGRHD